MAPLGAPEANAWLSEEHPGLTTGDGVVSGTISVNSSFDGHTGLFHIIRRDSEEPAGLILSGQFNIEIKGDTQSSACALPSLYVAGILHSSDRHFNFDGTACVCSPLEMDEFLKPSFDLRRYLNRLVIPFLYGQLYFDRHQRWPWVDYAHGATGLLESYFRMNDSAKGADCIRALSLDFSWPSIQAALDSEALTGDMRCFCGKDDQIEGCHPDAWRGLCKLQRDIRELKNTCVSQPEQSR